MAQNGFRRIIILLVIKSVRTSKIRNPAFCRDTGPAKKYNIIASIDEFFQFFCAIHTNHPFIPKLYDARGKISYTAL